MSNLNEAKNKLKLILEGKNPKKPTLEEARKNLIKNDPGINIAPFLHSINKGNYSLALQALLLELLNNTRVLEVLIYLLIKKEKN